jgi:hypothetical protein
MPKFLKDALEEYLRKAGATTKEEQDELVERLGLRVMPLRDEGQGLEVVRSDESGSQYLRGRDENSVRPELLELRERVILRHGRRWPDGRDPPDGLDVEGPHAPERIASDRRAEGGGKKDA